MKITGKIQLACGMPDHSIHKRHPSKSLLTLMDNPESESEEFFSDLSENSWAFMQQGSVCSTEWNRCHQVYDMARMIYHKTCVCFGMKLDVALPRSSVRCLRDQT